MKILRVASIDRSLWCAKYSGRVERSNFEDKRLLPGDMSGQMCAAGHAEPACHGMIKIFAPKSLGLSRRPGQPLHRQKHEVVGSTTAEILTFTTVALCLKNGFAGRGVFDCPAIAAAGKA